MSLSRSVPLPSLRSQRQSCGILTDAAAAQSFQPTREYFQSLSALALEIATTSDPAVAGLGLQVLARQAQRLSNLAGGVR